MRRCKEECATCDEVGECANTTAYHCKYYVQDAKCQPRDGCPLGTNFVRNANGSAPSASTDPLLSNESLECPLPAPLTFSSTVAPGATAAGTTREELQLLHSAMERENSELLECAEALRPKHVERLCHRCDAQCNPNKGCTGGGNHSCRLCAHKTYFPDETDESNVIIYCTIHSYAKVLRHFYNSTTDYYCLM